MHRLIVSRRLLTWYFLALVALGCSGCAIPPMHLFHRAAKEAIAVDKLRAEQYFVKARDYEMLGQSASALRYYTEAYALDPQSRMLRDLLAEKFVQAGYSTRALLLIKGNRQAGGLTDADKRLCAGIYLREGKLSAAVETLMEIKDKQAEDYYTMGVIDESKGNYAKAVRSYAGFLKKKPESLQMWTKVGGLYTALKQFDAAESLYVDMERRFGQAPEVYNGIGGLKLARGDTTLAINSFKMASLIDSTNTEGLRAIAQIYLRKGQWEQAVPDYEKLYASDPSADTFGRSLALLYYYTRHYDKARAIISRLLSENNDDYELHFYNGLTLAAQDSGSLAKSEFEKTITLRNDLSDAWEQLCYLELKENHPDSAALITDQFKKNMPRSPEAWRMAGYVCNVRKEYARAIAQLKKSLDLDSTDALTWFELGTSLERAGDREQSVLAFKRVLKLKPGDPAASNYLGYMWAERGVKLDSARLLLATALSKDSLNGAYLDSYAWIFFKMGDIDSAFIYIGKAINRIKDDPIVFSHYGDILRKKGDDDGALAAYKKGLAVAASDNATNEEISELKSKIAELEKRTKDVLIPPLPSRNSVPR